MRNRNHLLVVVGLFISLFVFSGNATGQLPFLTKTFDRQMNKLSKEMVKTLSAENKAKIAFMEFPDLNGNITELGKFIPEELTTRFFKTRKFNVVERSLLKQVLKEQNLGTTGLLDASSAAQIGKMLGVDAIVTGTISDMGSSIRINARLISTESATVFAVSSVDLERDDHVMSMLGKTLEEAESSSSSSEAGSSSEKSDFDCEMKEYRFKVKSCKESQSNMVLQLFVTNVGQDRDLEIGEIVAYDDLGNSYKAHTRKVGNQTRTGGGWFKNKFIANVKSKVIFEFKDVAPKAKNITLLEMKLYDKQSSYFDASIRDIKIR